MKICKECGTACENDFRFCKNCGTLLDEKVTQQANDNTSFNLQEKLHGMASNISKNEYVASVKNDITQSQSIAVLKKDAKRAVKKAKTLAEQGAEKTKSTNKKSLIIAVIIIIIAVLAAAIGFNTHRCEECEKIYIGKEHYIMGSNVCNDCFDDFYSMFY